MRHHKTVLAGALLVLLLTGCSALNNMTRNEPATLPASESVGQNAATATSLTGTTAEGATARSTGQSATGSALNGSLKSTAPAELAKVYFAYDSYILSQEARDALQENARTLSANPQWKILIAGHCDERGATNYNLALGERRANAVKSYLQALGIADNRLATVSYGEEQPAASGHDEAAWALNRRGELTVN